MADESKNLSDLGKNLKTNTVARAKFLAGFLDLLEKSGLDVQDERVIKELNLNLDLSDGEKFVKGLASSTNIITITS